MQPAMLRNKNKVYEVTVKSNESEVKRIFRTIKKANKFAKDALKYIFNENENKNSFTCEFKTIKPGMVYFQQEKVYESQSHKNVNLDDDDIKLFDWEYMI